MAATSAAVAASIGGLWLVAGCAEVDNPYLPFPEPSFDQYVSSVQPVVAQSCAHLGCHGSHELMLTLYAVDRLRAEPSSPGAPLGDRLTQAELAWNYDALRARLIDETAADQSRLLLKCLDPAKGGIVHAGGVVVFHDRTEPGYVALRDWIEGGL